MTRTTGTYERSTIAGESVEAFIPRPLPPSEPPLDLAGDLAVLLARANESIRMLELAGDLVPSIEWFVYAFVRKEAVLSAQTHHSCRMRRWAPTLARFCHIEMGESETSSGARSFGKASTANI